MPETSRPQHNHHDQHVLMGCSVSPACRYVKCVAPGEPRFSRRKTTVFIVKLPTALEARVRERPGSRRARSLPW
jgi:hypothetical protein